MTHTVTVAFLAEESEADMLYWISQIEDVLPCEITVSSKRDARAVDVDELGEDDFGKAVSFESAATGFVSGVLDAVYAHGTRNGGARVLIVDNAAYTLNYGVVQVGVE
jgi:hypothetical protein